VVAQETGTHRSERLPARGSASEDDVRIVVFVHTEETLQCRLLTDAAREFESAIVLADALSHPPDLQGILTTAVFGMA
jgi:hypothetical protein